MPGLRDDLLRAKDSIGARPGHALHLSIVLGGMMVFAGIDAGLDALLADAPQIPGREPLRLVNHGPFHSPLMQAASDRAMERLPAAWFGTPEAPMVDGRGHVWRPFASNAAALQYYTFVTQILETYHFT